MGAVRAPNSEASFRAYSQKDVAMTTSITNIQALKPEVDLLLTTINNNKHPSALHRRLSFAMMCVVRTLIL
jgi:hypothetical protein